MHEIVLVRTGYYEKGCEVHSERLIAKQNPNRLWWFDGPYTTRDLGLVLKRHSTELTSVMICEAIWFEFQCLPAPDYKQSHHQPNSSHMADEFEYGMGLDLFTEDLPELVKIVKRKVAADDYGFIDTDFYALYEVDLDKHYDDDGGLDTIDAIPTLLGELDFSKLPLALVEATGAKAE
jgi:hypothetical protein